MQKRMNQYETFKVNQRNANTLSINCIRTEMRLMRDEFQAHKRETDMKISDLKEENTFLKSAVYNQQRFLETYDGEKRALNLIVTGLSESDMTITNDEGDDETLSIDEAKLDYLMTKIEIDPSCIDQVQRLGVLRPEAERPRPCKVTLKGRQYRRPILEKAKKLKTHNNLSSVYINKDMHPAFRKERGRLRQAQKREADKPENAGKTVIYDPEERVLKVNDVIVDRYNPSPLF